MKWNALLKSISAELPLKFMSLGIAVLIWFLVTEAGIEEVDIKNVRVIVDGPETVAVRRIVPPYVNVKIMGASIDLRAVPRRGLTARYVIKGNPLAGSPTKGIEIDCKKKLEFSLPPGVSVTRVEPEDIRIDLVRRVKASVKVEAQIIGTLRPGFEITGIRIIPEKARVGGPEPVLKGLRAVQTVPINCEGRSESFSVNVGIENRVKGHDLRISDMVDVAIDIVEQLATREFRALKIMVMKPAGWGRAVTVSPDAINVTVKGQKQVLAVLGPERVVPYIHVTERGDGTYKLPVGVNIQLDGVELVGVLPNVEVKVGK